MSLTSIKFPEFKPPKGSGLEQLSKLIKSARDNYSTANNKPGENKYKPIIRPLIKQGTNANSIFAKDPIEVLKGSVQSLSKGLNNALGQILKGSETVDYTAVAKSFMPGDARLLRPKNPAKAAETLLADLDGDGRDELVATYKTGEGLRTMILKEQAGKWQKTSEIYHQNHDSINYRHVHRLAGDGKLHLLVGMPGGGAENTLYGYTLSDNVATRAFSRGYSWVEQVRRPKNASRQGGDQISVWNRAEDGHFDIEVLDWDGSQLKSSNDDVYYYRTRVAPYYLRKAKQNPNDLKGYYRLTQALLKAGAVRDARIVAEAGSRQTQDLQMRDKFISLKNEIMAEYF